VETAAAAEPVRTTAVLLAGGTGTRVGAVVPKQLLEIAGRPIIEHSIAAFDAHPDVDEVLVLMAAGHLEAARAIVRAGGYRKVTAVLEGAATRSGTAMRALDALTEEDGNVLLHDAVRPLVTARIISDCVAGLETHGAVDVAIPSSDTIIEVSPDSTLRAVPRRGDLRRVQTPQGFRLPVIREAYARARRDPSFEATDDCTVVLRYLPEVPILVVVGDERNLKVTGPTDVHLAEQLLRLRAEERAGQDAGRRGG
jgi:ribitol-5-phosphate 2-dehydrogenase (NADP+) / D-ribitol-5-phosphate cytidylyltransferase